MSTLVTTHPTVALEKQVVILQDLLHPLMQVYIIRLCRLIQVDHRIITMKTQLHLKAELFPDRMLAVSVQCSIQQTLPREGKNGSVAT